MTETLLGFHAQAREMAQVIDKFLNKEREGDERVGFVLMVYPLGKPEARVTYLSNEDRDKMVARLRAEVPRFEQQAFSEGFL
jgi:hypothetical protein